MPLFGAHLSIAGGLHNAVEAAVALGLETVQLFTHSPSQWAVQPASRAANQWTAKPLGDDEVNRFRKAVQDSKLQFSTAHDSYLINLAAPNDDLYRKSVAAFTVELERAESLGLSYVVTHPGAHTGSGDEAGIARIITALNEVQSRCSGYRVKVLLETTAGQGTTLGHRFEHLAAILHGVKTPERLGVCLDTCHVFAAGYPIHTSDGFAETFERFDELIGLEKLELFHINDSVKGLACRVDRHAGLGLGQIGLDAFRRLVTDARFQNHPMILETPKDGDDGQAMDPVNLGILRSFLVPVAGRITGRSRRPR